MGHPASPGLVPPPIAATAHHVGCAVAQLDVASRTYRDALGLQRLSCPIEVSSQEVRVQFVELTPGFFLELIEPLNDNTKLAAFLKVGFYHLCFLVPDLAAARKHVRLHRFLPLAAVFSSEAFAGRACQFFLNPHGQLIELAELSTAGFAEFVEARVTA